MFFLMLRFYSMILLLFSCMLCQADSESFVDETSSIIESMPETAVYEKEMADLHKRALNSVRDYLTKQKQAQIADKNYTKAAELENSINKLAQELDDAEIGDAPAPTETFMDGRKWCSKETGAVYTVQNGKLYRNGTGVGHVQIISPCILCVDARKELWVWCSDNEAMRVDSSFMGGGSYTPTILKTSDKAPQNSCSGASGNADVDKLAQIRYRSYMRNNMAPIRKKYIKALSAKMDACAKEGKLNEAADIQKFIATLPHVETAPAESAKSPKRPVGKFSETTAGGWSYIFSNKGWRNYKPSGKKVTDSKIVRVSPDKHVWVYQSFDSIECIFWHGERLMRLVVKPNKPHESHTRILIRAK